MTRAPRLVVLAGGVGGGKFIEGVRALSRTRWPDGAGGTAAEITVIVNTGDDVWLAGVRIAPDIDSITYRLAGVGDTVRGWGRAGETERVSAELAAYGVGWPWFTLGDLDLGTHLARTALLREGLPLSAATARLLERWGLGVRLLPMTDDEVETHVVVSDEDGREREIHFQEWWTRYRAKLPARRFVQTGVEDSRPAPGVLEAVAGADVVLIAPSNPIVSIGTILAVPGIRDALREGPAPVVGVSPIIGGAVVRGMADACLAAVGVETSAAAVAGYYGARGNGGVLDAWLVDTVDEGSTRGLPPGIRTAARPLLMTDRDEAAAIAAVALDLVADPR